MLDIRSPKELISSENVDGVKLPREETNSKDTALGNGLSPALLSPLPQKQTVSPVLVCYEQKICCGGGRLVQERW